MRQMVEDRLICSEKKAVAARSILNAFRYSLGGLSVGFFKDRAQIIGVNMKKIRGILYFNGFTVAGVNKGSCVLSIIFLPDGGGAAAGLGLDQAGKTDEACGCSPPGICPAGIQGKTVPLGIRFFCRR